MAEKNRIRLSAVAIKRETVRGIDAFGGGAPALSDFIEANMAFTLPQQVVEDDSVTGSFDRNAPTPTGIRPTLTLRVPLRGSGLVANAPEWGRLMTACRFEEIQQPAAVGAPTAATAGTEDTLTLAAPFASTSQAFRGMPILLSGSPAVARPSVVLDYTAGRVAKLAQRFDEALGTGTLAQVPANWLYRLTDDEALIQPVTAYGYRDGLRFRFVGCVGSVSWDLTSGSTGTLVFTLQGQLLGAYEAASAPVGWNSIRRPQKPLWEEGLSRISGLLGRCSRYTYGLTHTIYNPENPEAPQGYDPPEITEGSSAVTIDPFSSSSASPSRFLSFREGASHSYAAMLGKVPGNRIAFSHPSLRIAEFGDGERGGLDVEALNLIPDVPGQGAFVSVF